MADPEFKLKHSKHRNRNLMAKHLYDPNEFKGAYAMKVVDSRKQQYKRKRIRVTEIEQDSD